MYQSPIDELSKEFNHNYIDSIHTTGNVIFKHAIRQDLLRTNPTNGFVMPKKQVTVEAMDVVKHIPPTALDILIHHF